MFLKSGVRLEWEIRRLGSADCPERSRRMSRKVAVLMGGWSPEREVSLVSGKACAEGLREGGHQVIEYDVKRDLRALIDSCGRHRRRARRGVQRPARQVRRGRLHPGRAGSAGRALHPFRRAGLGIAMDKPMARHVFTSLGMRVAEGRVIERRSLPGRSHAAALCRQADRPGVQRRRAHRARGRQSRRRRARPRRRSAKGPGREVHSRRELTVRGDGRRAVAVTELRPRTRFYDYEAKYTDGITEHLVPAPIRPRSTSWPKSGR